MRLSVTSTEGESEGAYTVPHVPLLGTTCKTKLKFAAQSGFCGSYHLPPHRRLQNEKRRCLSSATSATTNGASPADQAHTTHPARMWHAPVGPGVHVGRAVVNAAFKIREQLLCDGATRRSPVTSSCAKRLQRNDATHSKHHSIAPLWKSRIWRTLTVRGC